MPMTQLPKFKISFNSPPPDIWFRAGFADMACIIKNKVMIPMFMKMYGKKIRPFFLMLLTASLG